MSKSTTTPLVPERDIVAAIRALAAENPNYVYEPDSSDGACRNLPSMSQPGCIVGQALLKVGVPWEVLKPYDTAAYSGIRPILGFSGESVAANWIRKVQYQQDDQKTWSVAVANADYVYHMGDNV